MPQLAETARATSARQRTLSAACRFALRNMQTRGGTRDISLLRKRHEIAKMPKLHTTGIMPTSYYEAINIVFDPGPGIGDDLSLGRKV